MCGGMLACKNWYSGGKFFFASRIRSQKKGRTNFSVPRITQKVHFKKMNEKMVRPHIQGSSSLGVCVCVCVGRQEGRIYSWNSIFDNSGSNLQAIL